MGVALAESLSVNFYDADDFHSEENKSKGGERTGHRSRLHVLHPSQTPPTPTLVDSNLDKIHIRILRSISHGR